MINLFAICGHVGQAEIKRIRTSSPVQQQLDGVFAALEGQFRSGIDTEIDFDGRWKPDENELLRITITPEIQLVIDALQGGPLALNDIAVDVFEGEQIRALVVKMQTGQVSRLLIQSFTLQQRLSRGFALFANGNTFDRLDRPAFSLGTKLDVIVEGGFAKFRSFYQIKRIFDLSASYREATDGEVQIFCNAEQFVADTSQVMAAANPTIRKLIGSVQSSGILAINTAQQLIDKATSVGVALPTENNRIKLPAVSKELKHILLFLDHGIYKSPLTDETYITNSRRRAT